MKPRDMIDELVDSAINLSDDPESGVCVEELAIYKDILERLEMLEFLEDNITGLILWGYDDPNEICWLHKDFNNKVIYKRLIVKQGESNYEKLKNWILKKDNERLKKKYPDIGVR